MISNSSLLTVFHKYILIVWVPYLTVLFNGQRDIAPLFLPSPFQAELVVETYFGAKKMGVLAQGLHL